MKFQNLKTKLSLQDQLPTGKYIGERVIDVKDYEYLVFLEKSGHVKYDEEAVEFIASKAGYKRRSKGLYLPNDYYEDDPAEAHCYSDEEIPF